MKKTLLLSFTALAFVALTSCKKYAMTDSNDISTTEETVNVTLNANEVYKYTLSDVNDVANVEVSAPAAKSAIAIVETSGTTNSFVYTPASNFSGTDVVVVSHGSLNTKQSECGFGDGKKKQQHNNHHCSDTKQSSHNSSCNNTRTCGNTAPTCEKPNQSAQHKITFKITVLPTIN